MIKLFVANNSECKEIMADKAMTLADVVRSAGFSTEAAILSLNGRQKAGRELQMSLEELGAVEGDSVAAIVKNTGSSTI